MVTGVLLGQEMAPGYALTTDLLLTPPGTLHSSAAPCLHFLRQETRGLRDYTFMTGPRSLFQDLHLGIKTSNGNRVNHQTLGIFTAGTDLD